MRGRYTAIVFAVIANHEHHLPLEDVVVHQPARDTREIFCCLHVFQLSSEQASCSHEGLRHV